jgi:branched-chain amino acid transport system substrate-binding protein
MKIGILYPRSNAYPGMMMDFMDGIKTALKQQQLNDNIQLVSESTGFGGNEKEVYEKAEKLLVLEGVDILVAYIDLRVLEIIKPLLYASGKLVLVVNPGANYPQNWVPQSNIVNLTLKQSFLCWLTGKLAAPVNKKNAAMATTFFDCGYLHTAAMVKSFVKAGGKITYNYVNNQKYDDAFDIKQLTGYLSSDKETNSLLCVFDSLPASLFYSLLNSYNGADSLHLFVSPMMLEEKALEKMGDGYKFSIDGYLPWHASLENNANRVFLDSYHQQTKRNGNVFSLSGWETGLILHEIFLHSNGNFTDGTELAGRLAKEKINSPRGEMKLDPETNYFIAPVCKCSIKQNSATPVVEWMENPEKEWTGFVESPTEGVSSGWTNTYLCY